MGRPAVSELRRLVTIADVHRQADDEILRVSARLELELASGTRLVLLNDRGWGGGGWASASASEVQKTARDVVGPDEPYGGRSQEDMAILHWNSLLDTARRQGVVTDVAELRQLPHDVVLAPRLLARIGSARDPD